MILDKTRQDKTKGGRGNVENVRRGVVEHKGGRGDKSHGEKRRRGELLRNNG